jgi:two-component system phosphate regulon sensor histidine kinase PhoR
MTVFKKSLLALGLTALGFNAVLVLSALIFMNSMYYEINTERLKSTAKTLMTAIGEDRIAEVFSANRSEPVDLPVERDSIYRLTLVDSFGYVIWDSQVTDRLVNHLDREEIVAALEGREAGYRRNSISTGMKMIYYALPVFDRSNKPIGVFRLSLTIPGLGAQVSPIILPFVIFSVLLAVVAFAAIYIYSRSLGTSIGRLVSITKTGTSLLSGQDTEFPVAPEFKSLENALRAMTAELNSRIEQAKAEGSRFEAILNGMSEAVFAMDSSLKLHVVNPRARELFFLGDRDIKNLSLLEATHSTELVDAAKKTISANTALEIELTFRTGVEQNFQVFTAPLLNNGGGVVLVLQDITRLLKLERVRKDFVANVSHELRTPIQVVKGFSETLLDTDLKSSEIKKIIHFIEIIQKNACIMENLTNDLLVLADLENNSSNGRELEEIDISSLIDEAISSVELQAKRKQIEINSDCDNKLTAKLYGSFIIQALINLIDNGIKYSPSKSKIKVKAYCEGEELILEVRDKGIGIPAEHLERIFERFYRVDRARSREAGGTGLGLSIVRHIALLHKGKVEVESKAGEGSIFRIRVPRQSYQ